MIPEQRIRELAAYASDPCADVQHWLAAQLLAARAENERLAKQRNELLQAVVQAIEAKPPLSAADPFHAKLYMRLASLAGVAAKIAEAQAAAEQPKPADAAQSLRDAAANCTGEMFGEQAAVKPKPQGGA